MAGIIVSFHGWLRIPASLLTNPELKLDTSLSQLFSSFSASQQLGKNCEESRLYFSITVTEILYSSTDMKILPLGSSGIIWTCYRFLTSMCHFLAKTQHKTIDKPENSSKQWILSVISVHFSQIQAFECKIGPFLDLFAQKSLISDQSPRKSDHLGALHQFGSSLQPWWSLRHACGACNYFHVCVIAGG